MSRVTRVLGKAFAISTNGGESGACAESSSPERMQLDLFASQEEGAGGASWLPSRTPGTICGSPNTSATIYAAYAKALRRKGIVSGISGSSSSPSGDAPTITSSGGCPTGISSPRPTRPDTGGSARRARKLRANRSAT